jgi:hypothetical protein
MLCGFCVAATITTLALGPPKFDRAPPERRDATRRGWRVRRPAASAVS